MAVGLSENAPIKLTLNKSNFDALIGRHGQWVRWVKSLKNSHAVTATGATKISSSALYDFYFQKTKIIYKKQLVLSFSNTGPHNLAIATVPANFGHHFTLQALYKNNQLLDENSYHLDETASFIFIDHLEKGAIIEATARVSRVIEANVLLKRIGNSALFVFNGANIELESLTVSPDIVAVTEIIAANKGINRLCLPVKRFSRNYIELDTSLLAAINVDDFVFTANISYIEGEKWAVLNQSSDRQTKKYMIDYNINAMMTFPQEFDVSTDDLITLLVGISVEQAIVRITTDSFDLPEYLAHEIISIKSEGREYLNGTDYLLAGANTVLWLTEKPLGNVNVLYRYHPTYKVVSAPHEIRSSENRLFARQVGLVQFKMNADQHLGAFNNVRN